MSERSEFIQSLNDEIHWLPKTAVEKPRVRRNPPPTNCTCRTTDDLACPYHSGDDEGKDYD